MRCLRSLVIASFFLSSISINAALPPLSERERQMESANIIEGLVYDIEEKIVDKGKGYVDVNYKVKMVVSKIIKGQNIDLGEEINIYYWKTKSRPNAWSGPGGQYGQIRPARNIRAYLTKSGEHKYELLEPNGFDNI